jgi:spore maturation protein CgeB
VAGPQYPRDIRWPGNVARMEHVAPSHHVSFYNAQRFALNVTRADMMRAGWSPSVRLFEAAACGTPVISDVWAGIEDFFVPGREILLARTDEEALAYVRDTPDEVRRRIGEAARARVLRDHTAAHRVRELEGYLS